MPFRLTTPWKIALSSGLLTGYAAYHYTYSRRSVSTRNTEPSSPVVRPIVSQPGLRQGARTNDDNMIVNHSFQTVFAVPLSCESCVKDVSNALYNLGGITKVEGNLKDQLISVEGSAAPSAIVEAIQDTGRDAILRGSGASDSAAVSILETFVDKRRTENEGTDREVRGLARMVEVGSGHTLVDLTIRGVAPGTYRATIREFGNLADGAESTGPVWRGDNEDRPRGALGLVEVGKDGRGSAFVDHPFRVWETIGHAMVLTRQDEGPAPLKNDENTVVGVIARSAGVWDNDKTVCSCTGKTLWEERKDEVAKGML